MAKLEKEIPADFRSGGNYKKPKVPSGRKRLSLITYERGLPQMFGGCRSPWRVERNSAE